MARDEPLSEITLRKYERPYKASRREIVRKICLSLGLLQPGDSRDVIVDIMMVLEEARVSKSLLSSINVQERARNLRRAHSLDDRGLAESNIRRQLKRLRDLLLVEKHNNVYHLTEFEPLTVLFEQKIEKFMVPEMMLRIHEYLRQLQEQSLNSPD